MRTFETLATEAVSIMLSREHHAEQLAQFVDDRFQMHAALVAVVLSSACEKFPLPAMHVTTTTTYSAGASGAVNASPSSASTPASTVTAPDEVALASLAKMRVEAAELTTRIQAQCKKPSLYDELLDSTSGIGELYYRVRAHVQYLGSNVLKPDAQAELEKLQPLIARCTVLPPDRYNAGDGAALKAIVKNGLAPKGRVTGVNLLGSAWKRSKGFTEDRTFYDYSMLAFAAVVVEPDGTAAIWEGDLRKDHVNAGRVEYYGNSARTLPTAGDPTKKK